MGDNSERGKEIKYKLTDQNMQTYGGFQWAIREWVETSGEGELCGPGWLHYSDDPLLALLLNPIQANIANPRLWRCEIAGKWKRDGSLKGGVTRQRLLEELPLPVITTEQKATFGILCAKQVYADPAWNAWADRWLSGEDRTAEAEAAWAAEAAGRGGQELDLITLAHQACAL